jgi:hypothetical protein
MELKKFIISNRLQGEVVAERDTRGRGTPTTKSAPVSESSGGSSGKKRPPVEDLHSATNTKKISTTAAAVPKGSLNEEAEEAMSKRMKLGRMDMFCKKENRAANPSKLNTGVSAKTTADLEIAAKLKREGSNIRYKFNPGYSNAVRRSVPIGDFC